MAGALAKAPLALEEEEGAEVEEGALQEVEEGLLLQPAQEEEEELEEGLLLLQLVQEEEALLQLVEVEEGQPAQEEEGLPPHPHPARGRAAAALPPRPFVLVLRCCSIVGQIEW